MKKKKLLSLLLFGLLLSTQATAQTPVAYISNTNVDFKNRLIFGELVYDAPDLCGRYELRFKTKIRRGNVWIDSARVRPVSSAIISNTNRYTLVGDSAITNLTASGFKLKVLLPAGTLPADSVALSVESYRLADQCLGCGVGSSDLVFTQKNIDPQCPYPNKDNAPTLLSCNRTATGAAQHWEAFVRDSRDCKIYRIVYFERSNQWWLAQNLDWRKAGKCYPTASSCDTSGVLYSWYEAVTGQKDVATVFNYPQIMNDNTGPQGVCPEGWHLPTDVEWNRLGFAIGSIADVGDNWGVGLQRQLMSFKDRSMGWHQQGSMRDMDNRYGFDWQATLFDGVKGVNNNLAVKFGAFWSAVSTAVDATDDPINRVVAMSEKGVWTLNPLRADSSHGNKSSDYLPVRCILGQGNVIVVTAAVPTPQVVITDTCSGNIAMRIGNAGEYGSSYLFEVNGGAPSASNVPYLRLTNPTNVNTTYSIRVKAANAEGYWSRWSAVQNVTIYQIPSATLSYTCNTDQTAVFTAAPSLGSGSYTYAFGNGGASFSAMATSNLALTAVNQTVYAKVMDSNGCISPQVNLTAQLPTTTIAAVGPINATARFTATATGGSGGYTYAWATVANPASYGATNPYSHPTVFTTVAGAAAQSRTAHLRVRDNKLCITANVSATVSMAAIPAGISFCASCGYNGSTWVDLWVDTNIKGAQVAWAPQDAVSQVGVTDQNNGRANSARLIANGATGGHVVQCYNATTGWYLPALWEVDRMRGAGLAGTSPAVPTITTSSAMDGGTFWKRCWHDGSVLTSQGTLTNGYNWMTGASAHYPAYCVWRP